MEKLYYGRGKDEDNERIIKFLDEVFFTDDREKRDFLSLLPKIYKEKYRPAYNNFVVSDNNGEFRAAIGSFYNYMTVGGKDISTCCIGNVAVGKKYRSKGYMIELMNQSIEDMKKSGIDMAYLGGQRQRYGYFGFESAGVCYKFGFNRQTVKHALGNKPSRLQVVELKEDDFEVFEYIDSIYRKNPVISQRVEDRYYDILCSWKSTPYILLDSGNFVGYFVMGRNEDFVLECGTVSEEYLPRMVLAIFEIFESYHFSFSTAPFETEKIKFFSENAEGMEIGGCESILVFDFEKTIGAYLNAKSTYAKLCDGEATVLIHGITGDENLKISVKSNMVNVAKTQEQPEYEFSHHAATRAFFSNYQTDRDIMKPEVQQWLPLPAFIFNTDTM